MQQRFKNNTKVLIIIIFSHFLYFIFFRIIRIIWKYNNKNQVEKILSPPGFEPGTSDTGLKTKKVIFRKRGPLFRLEVIDLFCWFSIANMRLPMATSYQNLNKLGQKLRPWESRIRNFEMVADDVINIKYQKSEKKDIGPCPGDHLWEISSKSAQPFRL